MFCLSLSKLQSAGNPGLGFHKFYCFTSKEVNVCKISVQNGHSGRSNGWGGGWKGRGEGGIIKWSYNFRRVRKTLDSISSPASTFKPASLSTLGSLNNRTYRQYTAQCHTQRKALVFVASTNPELIRQWNSHCIVKYWFHFLWEHFHCEFKIAYVCEHTKDQWRILKMAINFAERWSYTP